MKGEFFMKMYLLEKNEFKNIKGKSGQEKNHGESNDVYENKGSEKRHFDKSNDVGEKKVDGADFQLCL